MLTKIISGGQTGVDQAALRAAKAAGLATGGWAPRGWQTEDGPAPGLGRDYGLTEHEGGYAARNRANVLASVGTLLVTWFGGEPTGGTALTGKLCLELKRPTRRAVLTWDHTPQVVPLMTWLSGHGVHALNVAGPRESKCPGIGEAAEKFLGELFAAVTRKEYRPC
jgi:hypothetical protein